jgi:hypothetical protein
VKKVLIGILLVGLLVAGCDLFPSLKIEDIKGEWKFSDRTIKGEAATDVSLSILNEEQFDLGWATVNGHYHFAVDGTLEKNIFTGTYSGWNSVAGQIDDTVAISITLTLESDRLTASFEGSGTLDGLELSEGIKQ